MQSKGEIKNIDNVTPMELGIGVGNPDGLWGRFLFQNDVLVAEYQCLCDCDLMKCFRNSKIHDGCKFKA